MAHADPEDERLARRRGRNRIWRSRFMVQAIAIHLDPAEVVPRTRGHPRSGHAFLDGRNGCLHALERIDSADPAGFSRDAREAEPTSRGAPPCVYEREPDTSNRLETPGDRSHQRAGGSGRSTNWI